MARIRTDTSIRGMSKLADLECWVDSLGVSQVRTSECVQRLKRVRFLGTMRYVTELRYEPNRYEHSLAVAHLAHTYVCQLGLGEDDQRLAVLAALLHDIGHLPFSHASEVFFRQLWGKYHIGHTTRVARHLSHLLRMKGNESLADDVMTATKLVKTQRCKSDDFIERVFFEVFHGIVSADTLDGITRASDAIGLSHPDPYDIINGIFVENATILVRSRSQSAIRQFLLLKERVYNDYVYCARGMAAEAMLTKALQLSFRDLVDLDDFLRFDDDDTVERLSLEENSRQLMEDLEARNLFCSLREVAKSKYELIEECFRRNSVPPIKPADAARALESEINPQLGDRTKINIILHPTIRLNFGQRFGSQLSLLELPTRLDDITRNGRTQKAYGANLEVLVRKSCLRSTWRFRLPRDLVHSERSISISAQRYRSTRLDHSHGAIPTPGRIVRFLTHWAIESYPVRILDPASGEGIFLKQSLDRLIDMGVKPDQAAKCLFGIERETVYRNESIKRRVHGTKLLARNTKCMDFFEFVEGVLQHQRAKGYDVVVGNPPFIRSDEFDGKDRALECCRKIGVDLSGRVSSWAPYVVCSAYLLGPNGRLGMVLPIELLSTDYALPVRQFLKSRFTSLKFVFFRQSVFPSALQDVLLLLASSNSNPGTYRKEVVNEKYLSQKLMEKFEQVKSSPKWVSKKWTGMLIDQKPLSVITQAIREGGLCTFGDIAKTTIGQVTGCNQYFVLGPEQSNQLRIDERWLKPIVTRAADLPGAVFDDRDMKSRLEKNVPSHLLCITSTANVKADKHLKSYLEQGKRDGVHLRYKCRTRWPWYSVPMQQPPHAFLTYMSHIRVRLILNEAGINSTNNIHNVNFLESMGEENRRAVVVSFFSTLTQLSLEILGRAYGGGVLKIEPGEVRRILVLKPDAVNSRVISTLSGMLEDLDAALRNGDDAIIEFIDKVVMKDGLGLDKEQIHQIQKAYKTLRERRMLRYK